MKRILLVGTIDLLLISCGGFSSVKPEYHPLKIAYTDWPGDYILFLADELGFFNQYNVDVLPIHYNSFNDEIPDLAIGKIDGLNIVPIDLLPIVQNNDIRVIMVTGCSNGADQIVASTDIDSIAALRGKRIGASMGTDGEFLVIEMLKRAGLSLADVTLVNISPDKVPYAIPELIDAGHTWEPYTTIATDLGQHIIFSSAETPGLLPDIFTVRLEVIQSRPDDIRNFVAAWLEATDWWLNNPTQGSQIIANRIGADPVDISFEGLKMSTAADNDSAFSDYPGVNPTSIHYVFRQSLSFSINSGYITIPPDINTILDPSFLP
jgi:NitT/TauT family transport system substrate-binding protein